ncbi:hypothetical protein [Anaerorudis cellulosivorans]|uniref:hypothetical protein n=1 Tax=Anaerorudis cellulosivorans TaxID=3397862 RepID=UPI0022210252|nr:hypothetical protein [Seramator thermalis]
MITNNQYNMNCVNAADRDASYLLVEFQQGNIEAFSQLYDLYANVLFNYGCKLTNDRVDNPEHVHPLSGQNPVI